LLEGNPSMSAPDRRRSIQSARWTAALLAPPETLTNALRAQVEEHKRRISCETARVAAYKAAHAAGVTTQAAKLSPEEIAALPGRIATYTSKGSNYSLGKSSRKRARIHARDLRELLAATEAK
jgi:hypothetical protein